MILRLLRAGLRRVFNLSFLAALSLLLGIGLGCLWERSLRVHEGIEYIRSSRQSVGLTIIPRRFHFFVYTPWDSPPNYRPGWHFDSSEWDPRQTRSFLEAMWKDSWLGFDLARQDYDVFGAGRSFTSVIIPLWFPMVLTLIAPLCWLRRWRRRARRVRLGLCLHCGYDLRATPDATGPRLPRCPECGRESS
ncbi:MAG: hypothetical protein ACHRHE_11210 [Tepidisphaerales bacterium]